MKSKITGFVSITFTFIGILCCQLSHSQIVISLLLGDKLNTGIVEFGIDGGYSRSYLTGIEGVKGLDNFHLGFYFDFLLKNNWYLNTGVRVKSNSGATNIAPYDLDNDDLDSVFSDGHVTRKISYFYVPVHLKYQFDKPFFINIGIQAGLRHISRDLFYNTISVKDDVEFTNDIRDKIKRLDAGLSGGAGYKFGGTGMNVGITYYYGLVDIMKDNNVKSFNSSFYVYINVPIGAGYRDKKEQK